MEEIDTESSNIFPIFSEAATSQGFRIHLKSLKLWKDSRDDTYEAVKGLIATDTQSPQKMFSQRHGTGWGKTLQVLYLNNFDVSDQAFEAFQYCTNLREMRVCSPSAQFTGKGFDIVFQQTPFVKVVKLWGCRYLCDVSGIRHLEYLNKLSFFYSKFKPKNDDPTCGMSSWNNEGQFMYLEKFVLDCTSVPDPEVSFAFLEKAVPNLIEVRLENFMAPITDKVFGYLRGACCESLKSIDVRSAELTDKGAASTLKSMKKLENLTLKQIGGLSCLETMFPESVTKALSPTLKVLVLDPLSDSKFSAINKSVLENVLSKLNLLEELEMNGMSFDVSCSENALLDLPNLREFVAREVDGLANIQKFSGTENLSSINFLRSCPNLVRLNVYAKCVPISYAERDADIKRWREANLLKKTEEEK